VSGEAQGSVTPLQSEAGRGRSQQEFNLVQLSLHSLVLQLLTTYPMSFSWRELGSADCSSWPSHGMEWNANLEADRLWEGRLQAETNISHAAVQKLRTSRYIPHPPHPSDLIVFQLMSIESREYGRMDPPRWPTGTAKVSTNFSEKRRSLSRYSSIADSGQGVCYFLSNSPIGISLMVSGLRLWCRWLRKVQPYRLIFPVV
jgi:hypothetical protein